MCQCSKYLPEFKDCKRLDHCSNFENELNKYIRPRLQKMCNNFDKTNDK